MLGGSPSRMRLARSQAPRQVEDSRKELPISPTWRGLVLLGAVGGLALTQPDLSQAGEASSLYTCLDLAGHRRITPPEAREYGAVWRCQGHDGMTVRVAEGDLRFFVSYGPNAATQTAAGETLPAVQHARRRQARMAPQARGGTLEAVRHHSSLQVGFRWAQGIDPRRHQARQGRRLPCRLCRGHGQQEGQRAGAGARRPRRSRICLQTGARQELRRRRPPDRLSVAQRSA